MLHVLEVAELPVSSEGVYRRLERTCQFLQGDSDIVGGVHSRTGEKMKCVHNNYVIQYSEEYRIVELFRGRKLLLISENMKFRGEIFRKLLACYYPSILQKK